MLKKKYKFKVKDTSEEDEKKILLSLPKEDLIELLRTNQKKSSKKERNDETDDSASKASQKPDGDWGASPSKYPKEADNAWGASGGNVDSGNWFG